MNALYYPLDLTAIRWDGGFTLSLSHLLFFLYLYPVTSILSLSYFFVNKKNKNGTEEDGQWPIQMFSTSHGSRELLKERLAKALALMWTFIGSTTEGELEALWIDQFQLYVDWKRIW